jgi:hypothetical protein
VCLRGSTASPGPANGASISLGGKAGNGGCTAAATPTSFEIPSSRRRGLPPIRPEIGEEHRIKNILILFLHPHAPPTTD